jgi:hypothetical protein
MHPNNSPRLPRTCRSYRFASQSTSSIKQLLGDRNKLAQVSSELIRLTELLAAKNAGEKEPVQAEENRIFYPYKKFKEEKN